MLVEHDQILLERRSLTKRLAPGALVIPGGHVEPGASVDEALRRELQEELGLTANAVSYVCTLLHRAEELRKLHYFAVDAWTGEPRPLEADGLEWVHLRNLAAFDCDVDRVAVDQYIRL